MLGARELIVESLGGVVPDPFRLLLCGQRNFIYADAVRDFLIDLRTLVGRNRTIELIEGEAPGADIIGRNEGENLGYIVRPFPAPWAEMGKAAGPWRNDRMLDERPHLVVAFLNLDDYEDPAQGRGTKDTVRKARARGIPVIEVRAKRIRDEEIMRWTQKGLDTPSQRWY